LKEDDNGEVAVVRVSFIFLRVVLLLGPPLPEESLLNRGEGRLLAYLQERNTDKDKSNIEVPLLLLETSKDFSFIGRQRGAMSLVPQDLQNYVQGIAEF